MSFLYVFIWLYMYFYYNITSVEPLNNNDNSDDNDDDNNINLIWNIKIFKKYIKNSTIIIIVMIMIQHVFKYYK